MLSGRLAAGLIVAGKPAFGSGHLENHPAPGWGKPPQIPVWQHSRGSAPVTQLTSPAATSAPPAPRPGSAGDTCLEIDLTRLQRNADALQDWIARAAAPTSPPGICGVIKKDGYGLGAVPLARRLQQAGARMLAVYDAGEAEQLVSSGITTPLLVLMPVRRLSRTAALYRHAATGRLQLAVHDPDQLAQLEESGHKLGIVLPIHLYLDTGMSRAGLRPEQLGEVFDRLEDSRFLKLTGVYSHLATADVDPAFVRQQQAAFDGALAEHAHRLPATVTRHLANTFATLRDPELHYEMVRPGLGLLGYGPDLMAEGPVASPPELAPVLRWVSRLVHVQDYPAGASVGYGATYELARPSVLGIVPVGYGDGYPHGLSNRGTVRVLTAEGPPVSAPVVGRVNMDQLVVDLTDVPQGREALLQGEVEIYSNDPASPNALPTLASLAGSHCYELLCRLSPNLPRRYIR